jgi:RHS repeat-associated protein
VTSVAARFRYDAQHRRVARWSASSGEWTYFVHGPSGELLSELRVVGGAWTPVRDYVWLDGRPLAQLEYVTPGAAPRAYYFHVDHLGTPRKLTSPEGATVWSAAVQPYGEVGETTVADPVTGRTVVTNLRLPGQYDERLLGGLGLQGPFYNWNRWYLPGVGRYLELDPIAMAGGFNGEYVSDWYNYAGANPLRWTDRTGLCLEDACVGEGIAVGTALDLLFGWGLMCALDSRFCGPLRPPQPPSPPLDPCHAGPSPQGPPRPNPAPMPMWPAHQPSYPNPGSNCPPCTGYLPPPRVDTGHSHYPCPGDHVHYFVWEQNPTTCQCFVKDRLGCL